MTQIPAAGSAVVAAIYTYTWTTEIPWRKRDSTATPSRGELLWVPRPLPQEESTPTLALTGFHCFSRPLTSKMVLLYYAKVCFGWLSFADKGEGVAEYIKGGYLQRKGRSGQNRLCSISGRSSSDFRKIKILSKHLLASGWGSFSKSKSHRSLGTVQAWFPTGELIHGHGSCLPTSLPTGFSEWGLSHISHAWNSSPHSLSQHF